MTKLFLSSAFFLALTAPALAQQQAQPNLFPKSAIESSAAATTTTPSRRDVPTPIPIDAIWRSVEHAVFDLFHPDAATVSDGNPVGHLGRQLLRPTPPVAAAPPDRKRDDSTLTAPSTPSGATQLDEHRAAQVERVQQAYEEPAGWMTTLVEARLRDGEPDEIVVVRGSGRGKLDRHAREAVESALRNRSTRPTAPAIARFRVEAGVSIAMPAKAFVDPVRHKPRGVMINLGRGELGGPRPAEVTAPLQPRVRTRVTLVEVLR